MSNKELTDQDLEDARKYFTSITQGRGERGQFAPGQTGNPKGRPKEPDGLVDMLIFRINKEVAKAIADKLIDKAKAGDMEAIKYIYDRVEGRPRQAVIQQTGAEPLLVALMRKLTHDNQRALAGRPLLSEGAHVPADSIIEGEVREVASPRTRPSVRGERPGLGNE